LPRQHLKRRLAHCGFSDDKVEPLLELLADMHLSSGLQRALSELSMADQLLKHVRPRRASVLALACSSLDHLLCDNDFLKPQFYEKAFTVLRNFYMDPAARSPFFTIVSRHLTLGVKDVEFFFETLEDKRVVSNLAKRQAALRFLALCCQSGGPQFASIQSAVTARVLGNDALAVRFQAVQDDVVIFMGTGEEGVPLHVASDQPFHALDKPRQDYALSFIDLLARLSVGRHSDAVVATFLPVNAALAILRGPHVPLVWKSLVMSQVRHLSLCGLLRLHFTGRCRSSTPLWTHLHTRFTILSVWCACGSVGRMTTSRASTPWMPMCSCSRACASSFCCR
jgi:hypothetical protein